MKLAKAVAKSKAKAKAAHSHNLAICGEQRSTKSSSGQEPSRMAGQDHTDIRSVCQSVRQAASWLNLDGARFGDGSVPGHSTTLIFHARCAPLLPLVIEAHSSFVSTPGH